MARLTLKPSIIRALFAKAGNVCAFPGCNHELITHDNLYVAEICHIEAAEPGGPRYNPKSNDEQRRSYENLLLLCHAHHRRVDSDTNTYSVEILTAMKAKHESSAIRNIFHIDASVIYQVNQDIKAYWSAVEKEKENHPVVDLAVDIDTAASGSDIFKSLHQKINQIEELFNLYQSSDDRLPFELRSFLQSLGYNLATYDAVPYYENPFENRNWESHNISSPNILKDVKVLLLQAELHYLTEFVKINTTDASVKLQIEKTKSRLSTIIQSEVYHD